MAEYWMTRPRAEQTTLTVSTAHTASHSTNSASIMSDFDRHRLLLLTEDDEGWAAELRRYLKDMPADVTKDTDVINWWQVSPLVAYVNFAVVTHQQNVKSTYHTYAHFRNLISFLTYFRLQIFFTKWT
jgi:hypothetical protein